MCQVFPTALPQTIRLKQLEESVDHVLSVWYIRVPAQDFAWKKKMFCCKKEFANHCLRELVQSILHQIRRGKLKTRSK